MPSIEWSTSELMQVTTALANRGEQSLAQLSRDLSTSLGRPYSGVYSKVRELVNQEHTPINNENTIEEVIEQTDPIHSGEDGRSLLNFMENRIIFHESKANELKAILQEYQSLSY